MKVLVDGNLLANRCRHAPIRALATKDGRPTGVVYGVLRGLAFYQKHFGACNKDVTVVWDGGLAAGRLELFDGYKSGRRKPKEEQTPEEQDEFRQFCNQLSDVQRGVVALGYRQVRVPGTEADDIISVLAHFNARLGHVCTIISNDKDFHHIISKSILLYDPGRDKLLRVDDARVQWGVEKMEHILLARAMVGDASDCVPGVSGVGPQRARMILRHWGKDPEDIPAADRKWVLRVVKERRSIFERNLRIIRLPTDWSESFYTTEQAIEVMSQYADVKDRDWREFAAICEELEFGDLLSQIQF